MGTIQCVKCFITAEAKDKVEGLSKIDHAANSKKCDGKDENCVFYKNGIPAVVPDGDIDPKRPIQGMKIITKSAPKKTGK